MATDTDGWVRHIIYFLLFWFSTAEGIISTEFVAVSGDFSGKLFHVKHALGYLLPLIFVTASVFAIHFCIAYTKCIKRPAVPEKEVLMIRFNNDYSQNCIPDIMEALHHLGDAQFPGYGQDGFCDKAVALLREQMGWEDADVHFVPGATQANLLVHAAALNPVQSVICAETGHIASHEAGAIENTGHQILALPCRSHDGKLAAEDVRAVAAHYQEMGAAEYLTEPKLVYISQPTEFGGVYSLEELQAIKEVCEDYDMQLFVDGARLSYALAADCNDATLWDLAALCDVFTIGGTKCGALFGEAIVITNDALKPRFRAHMKQHGAVLAKGWLLGLQFYCLFRTNAYYKLAEKADQQAQRIQEACKLYGIPLYTESPSNQQFVLLTKAQEAALAKTFTFEIFDRYDETHDIVRLCTSWATTDLDVDALLSFLPRI